MFRAMVMRYVPFPSRLPDQESADLAGRLNLRTFAKRRVVYHQGSVDS